jgi:DNA-directed RNA polymerase subunit M/transcription elongation factor TFIIS
MNFCDECRSVRKDVTTANELYSVCGTCNKRFTSKPEDTLRFTEKFDKKESESKYAVLLKNAAFDNCNPRMENPCPKCDEKIVSYIVVGDDMKLIYVCRCGNQF